MIVQHKFVEFIPEVLEEGVLYISLTYGTVLHNCACGCGNRVNTPLGPNDWQMMYDGQSVTLKPSIGNWSFDCKSHYWISNNEIEWSYKWSKKKIERIRKIENSERDIYYKDKNINDSNSGLEVKACDKNKSWFRKFIFWK